MLNIKPLNMWFQFLEDILYIYIFLFFMSKFNPKLSLHSTHNLNKFKLIFTLTEVATCLRFSDQRVLEKIF